PRPGAPAALARAEAAADDEDQPCGDVDLRLSVRGLHDREVRPVSGNQGRRGRMTLIAAMARNRTIGYKGRMPWHLPEDLRRFKAITMGHVLVMGRATFVVIGRPRPGRRTIGVTRQEDWAARGVTVAPSIEDAIRQAGGENVFIAGGADIFRQTIDRAQRLYLTLIDRDFQGDAF